MVKVAKDKLSGMSLSPKQRFRSSLSGTNNAELHSAITVVIHRFDGNQVNLVVEPAYKIERVKVEIEAETGVHPDRQSLFFEGKELDDGHTLFDCNVASGSTIRQENRDFETKEVRVRLTVHRLLDIDLQLQKFTVHLSLEASWVDKALKQHMHKTQGCKPDEERSQQMKAGLFVKFDDEKHTWDVISVQSEKKSETNAVERAAFSKWKELTDRKIHGPYFTPRISWKNALQAEKRASTWFTLYDNNEGDVTSPYIVCFRKTETTTFQQRMELRLFPIDEQNLTICMSSAYDNKARNGYKVMLTQNLSPKYVSFVNQETFIHSSEYTLHSQIEFQERETKIEESATKVGYPLLDMKLIIVRKCTYWTLNVVLPLFFMVCCSLVSFVLPPEDVPNRLSVSLTMMLTMIAFKFIVTDKLPPVSYLTLIDSYILLCFMCMVLLIFVQGSIGMQLRMAERQQKIIRSKNKTAVPPPTCQDIDDCEGNPATAVLRLLVMWAGLHALFGLAYFIFAMKRARRLHARDDAERPIPHALYVAAASSPGLTKLAEQIAWETLKTRYCMGTRASLTDLLNAYLRRRGAGVCCAKALLWSPEGSKNAIIGATGKKHIPSGHMMTIKFKTANDANLVSLAAD
jgi:hypothetical protein